jgi:uncharacterized protein (TIGR04222 family)
MPINGPTWGMTGPAFLALYGVAAVAALLGAWQHKAWLASRGPRPRLDRLHPYGLAFLAGGPHRAITAAVAALRADGVLEPEERDGTARLRDTGRAPTPSSVTAPAWGTDPAAPSASAAADALDRAVLGQVREGRPVHELDRAPDGAAALDALRAELVGAGALLTPEQRAPARLAAVWPGAVAVLGAARVSAGLANDRPVAWILIATVLMTVATVVVGARSPDRHGSVPGALAELRRGAPHLEPSTVPSLTTYGAAAAATAVALSGFAVLAAADPALAQTTEMSELQRRMATTGDGGGGSGDGGGGGCGGGCGGCGG